MKYIIILTIILLNILPANAQRTISIKYLNEQLGLHKQEAITILSLPATSKVLYFYVNNGKLFIHCVGEHGEYDFKINDCELVEFLKKVENE